MIESFHKILVIQTAFLGDAILTLPLVQILKKHFPDSTLDIVVTPHAAGLFENHPAITRIVRYDKRGSDKGIRGFNLLKRALREQHYDLAIIPHRSIRSALLARFAHIPERVGFNSSGGKFLMTKLVRYRKDLHEIERNLSLLQGIGLENSGHILPTLYPSEKDKIAVSAFLVNVGDGAGKNLVAIAPGTIWNTKRWPKERFAEVARQLVRDRCVVALIGSSADRPLCEEIASMAGGEGVLNSAGSLTLLQSAELVPRCKVIISNDSAPMHMAVAVRTPVVAIFGATVPAFGFSPYGERDTVVETLDLSCRPCSIHGGERCPIKTFDCMLRIDSLQVLQKVRTYLE